MYKGYSVGIIYIMVVALASIWLHDIGQSINILALLFYCTLLTSVFYIIIDIKQFKVNHLSIFHYPMDWLKMSLAIVVVWLSTYYCNINGRPYFFLTTFFLSSAIIASLKEKCTCKCSLCIISLIICFYFEKDRSWIVFLISMFGGYSAYLYSYSSYQFSKKANMSAKSVISIRFYILLFLSAVAILCSSHSAEILLVGWPSISVIIVLAFFHMIIPVFLSQSSLQILGANRFIFLTTLLPIVTFIMNCLVKNVWSDAAFWSCLFACIVLNLNLLQRFFYNLRSAINSLY